MRKLLIFLLVSCGCCLIGFDTYGQANPPVNTPQVGPNPLSDFQVKTNQGRPSIVIADDPDIEWLQVYIGTPDLQTVHQQWYEKVNAICDGTTCEFHLDAHPVSGEYVVYIQPWGLGHYVNDDSLYWAGPEYFALTFNAPIAPTSLNISFVGGKPRFNWQSSAGATWYQVWVGTASATYLSEWFAALDIGCASAEVCSITPNITLPFGGSFDWYVQAWGPGGDSTGGTVDGWTKGPAYMVGFTGFGLGGQVDQFEYPQHMHDAGMTWVKRQLNFSMGANAGDWQSYINQVNQEGFLLLFSVKGSKTQLSETRQEFIQAYAQYVAGLATMMGSAGAIEIWNEPNLEREWPQGQISGGGYTELLIASYNAIKAANPNIMVISAAPAPTGTSIEGVVVPDDQFLQQMKTAGAANYLDCVGIHYNEGILPPTATSGDPRSEHYTRYYSTMIETYANVFPGKSLCFTELGYLTAEGIGQLPAGFEWAVNTTVANQAEWLGLAAQLSKNNPLIRLMVVWNVDFTHYSNDPMAGYAIVRPGGGCPACASLGAAMQ